MTAENCIVHASHPQGSYICADCTEALKKGGKIRIDTSDPETRKVWEAAVQAKAEVESWPAWKRGEEDSND